MPATSALNRLGCRPLLCSLRAGSASNTVRLDFHLCRSRSTRTLLDNETLGGSTIVIRIGSLGPQASKSDLRNDTFALHFERLRNFANPLRPVGGAPRTQRSTQSPKVAVVLWGSAADRGRSRAQPLAMRWARRGRRGLRVGCDKPASVAPTRLSPKPSSLGASRRVIPATNSDWTRIAQCIPGRRRIKRVLRRRTGALQN